MASFEFLRSGSSIAAGVAFTFVDEKMLIRFILIKEIISVLVLVAGSLVEE